MEIKRREIYLPAFQPQPIHFVQREQTHGENLLVEEKGFFEQLFPTAIDEVRSYHAYQRDGTSPKVMLGTLIDRLA